MSGMRIGTRGSSLALAQAQWVQLRLADRYPGMSAEVRVIKTSGDRFQTVPIAAIGAKGVFIKEIEEALVRGEIDVAVHSMKDLPTAITEGLTVAAIPERAESRDALVSRTAGSLAQLPSGARVGTGSLRRRAQILHVRPDLEVVSIRGNVDTRLRKLDEGFVDALVLAYAGLDRIGRASEVVQLLPTEICTSAVAQGALGLECRSEDPVRTRFGFLHHESTALEVEAERSFLRRLEGGCQLPAGAKATVQGDSVSVVGVVAEASGARLFRREVRGPRSDSSVLGVRLAEELLADGAGEVLRPLDPRSLG